MIDLVPTEDDLDGMEDDVVERLREAGVLPPVGSAKGKGKGRAVAAAAKHIVFVDNEDQGMFRFGRAHGVKLISIYS